MSMARTYKTMAFSLPPEMAERVEQTARENQLTKSEFFREMFRLWEQQKRRSEEEQIRRFRLLSEEGYKQAHSLGIAVEREEEIDGILYETRQARKQKIGTENRS